MIKGAQKRMIVVRTADSPIFEEAYFVMRNGKGRDECDMIDEANRIIDSSGARRREKRRDPSRTLIFTICSFIGGSVIGSAITLAVTLIAYQVV